MRTQNLSRNEAIRYLIDTPYLFGHRLGFKDLTPLHNKWMRSMILGTEDETLQAHRGSYKTTCVAISLAVIMIVFPKETIIFMRKTDTDVKEVIATVQKILEHKVTRALVWRIWGKKIEFPVSSSTAIDTNLVKRVQGTNQLLGIGTQSSLTGKHADRVFTDDIVNLKDRASKAERDRIKTVYQELQNVKNRKGRIYNTGTPWHKDDCFTLMPAAKKYNWKSTGLISEEEAEKIRGRMLKSLFAANYDLRHIAEDDVIFDNPVTGGDPAMVEQGLSHTDAAYWGEDTTAFTIAKRHDDKYYVFGKVWEKHVDSCTDIIEMYHNQFHCGKMYNERNADKGYLAKRFRQDGIKVISYDENENKYIKITSFLKFEWKNVVFVEGTDEKYIQQITDFNEKAEHDDCADSLASLIRVLSGKKPSDHYHPIWNN